MLFIHFLAVYCPPTYNTLAIKVPIHTLRNEESSHRALEDNNRMGRQATARQPDPQRRVLRPRKRNLDIVESTTIKRRNARLIKQKPPDLPTTTTDYDDGIYTPEFQEIESWEDRYFKIKVPGTAQIRQKVARLMKQNGGEVPKPILRDILRPRLLRWTKEMNAKGPEYTLHLLELWKMENVWTFPVDNAFAALFYTQIRLMDQMVLASRLCTHCTGICLDKSMGFRGSRRIIGSCGLCKRLSQSSLDDSDEAAMLKSDRPSLFRVCAAPGWSARYSCLRKS